MTKITILGLHLNYGGVEQAIINQANFFADNYDVELAITYKIINEPAFALSDKVKVKYLTKDVPNRENFKKYLSNKQIFKAFKEGVKSLTILWHKYNTMKKFIKKCDADIIISSRVDITKILNKYAPKNCITIAEEHRHHNFNYKYINKLKKSCKNIDYLISVSQELNKFYTENIIGPKCIYIPNSLEVWPIETANLNNKNIISIGRLSSEKGFLDLIDVFKIIYDLDNDCHLDIIGYGNDFPLIKQKILNYKLSNNITLHGFQNRTYINKYLKNSSLYLMCSYEESFGIVLIEAASFGVPAIAFDSAQGANEIIINNKNGYLIPSRDKKAMATSAIQLLNNKTKLKSFGKEARKNAQKFGYENVRKIWLKFIDEIIKAKEMNK